MTQPYTLTLSLPEPTTRDREFMYLHEGEHAVGLLRRKPVTLGHLLVLASDAGLTSTQTALVFGWASANYASEQIAEVIEHEIRHLAGARRAGRPYDNAHLAPFFSEV